MLVLYLIPKPKEIRFRPEKFRIPRTIFIWLDPHLKNSYLMRRLTQALEAKAVFVRECSDPAKAWIAFRLTDHIDMDYSSCGANIDHVLPEIVNQGYRLNVTSQGIVGEAKGVEGLRYAVSTLLQILKQTDRELTSCRIVDYPLYPARGVMLDVSRGKMPTLETLKELVSLLVDYKINILQLYIEHVYHFPSNPRIGECTGRLDGEQIRELDRFCQDCGIELQPNLQTFSHFHGTLRLPEYYKLAENDGLWTLAPGQEESYHLLQSMLEDFLPAFSSRTFNMNMDEAYDIGTGVSRTRCEEYGRGRVYRDHILRVYEQAKSLGIQNVQLWGEMVNKYPELLDGLPDDLTFIDWHYNPDTEYPSLKRFFESKRPFWVASGVSSWNSIFPRVENAYINITHLAQEGFKYGASGFLNTDWGDYGHYQPLGLSFTGYIFGAEQSWNAGETDKDEFERALKQLYFKNDREFQVWELLKYSNTIDELQTGFKTKTIYAFFDDPLRGISLEPNDKMEPIPLETFKKYYETVSQAWDCCQQLGDTKFEKELKLAAWMSFYTAKKGIYSHELRELIASGNLTTDEILNQVAKLKELYQELVFIQDFFSEVWNLRARPEGKEISLLYFSKLSVQFYELVKWLNKQRVRLAAGREAEGLDAYQGMNDYTTLWTQDFSNLWDRAYPWN